MKKKTQNLIYTTLIFECFNVDNQQYNKYPEE